MPAQISQSREEEAQVVPLPSEHLKMQLSGLCGSFTPLSVGNYYFKNWFVSFFFNGFVAPLCVFFPGVFLTCETPTI